VKIYSGFTLVELLVVIAIIGILAAVVLVAVNPLEQLARTRDSGRKTAVAQLGRALEAYNITQGQFPNNNTNWMTALVISGELKLTLPLINNPGVSCWGDATANAVNNYCYALIGSTAYTWTNLESRSEITKCGVGATSTNTYFVYDTSLSGACIKCNINYSGSCNSQQ